MGGSLSLAITQELGLLRCSDSRDLLCENTTMENHNTLMHLGECAVQLDFARALLAASAYHRRAHRLVIRKVVQ